MRLSIAMKGGTVSIQVQTTHLLIDTGISKKRIEEDFMTSRFKGEEIDGDPYYP